MEGGERLRNGRERGDGKGWGMGLSGKGRKRRKKEGNVRGREWKPSFLLTPTDMKSWAQIHRRS